MKQIQKNYQLSEDQKNIFTKLVILDNMNAGYFKPSLILTNNDELLEDVLSEMLADGYLKIEASGYYITSKGQQELQNFWNKLYRYRDVYKIYSAVDTGTGEIGYESYYDFSDDQSFINYISDERFEDLRIAVAVFKGINPFEMVFLEKFEEGCFDASEHNNWQLELFSEDIWSEMKDVVNSAIKPDDLSETDYTGDEVMELIINKATIISVQLIEQDSEIDEEDREDVIEEIECHFDPYYKEVWF